MNKIMEQLSTYSVKGLEVEFIEKILINELTNEEIFSPELEQENDIALFNAYRKLKGLLLPSEIKRIRNKFGLTQVEFSRILGLGDKSITRYENGSLQDLAQNNLILGAIKDPVYFLELTKNCQKLKEELDDEDFDFLFNKVKIKVEELTHFRLNLNSDNFPIKNFKVYDTTLIAKFILKYYDYENTKELITPLKLQKLLNYVYSYILTLYNTRIVDESLLAWAHGPVFRSIYDEYKNLGYSGIPIPKEEISLENPLLEKLVLKVANGYGRFTAKELEHLTHKEDPWILARKRADVKELEYSNEKIMDDDIKNYFTRLLSANRSIY